MSKRTVKDFPFVEITLRAYNTRPTEQTNNEGIMVFATFPTEVTDPEQPSDLDEYGMPKNLIGSISGGIGHVVISFHAQDGAYFLIPHDEIWHAINKALEEQSKEKK